MREWYPRPLDECDNYMERLTRFELANKMPGWKPGALPLGDSRILVPHKYLVFNELFLCVATAMLMHMLYLTTIVVINWYAAWGMIPQPMD